MTANILACTVDESTEADRETWQRAATWPERTSAFRLRRCPRFHDTFPEPRCIRSPSNRNACLSKRRWVNALDDRCYHNLTTCEIVMPYVNGTYRCHLAAVPDTCSAVCLVFNISWTWLPLPQVGRCNGSPPVFVSLRVNRIWEKLWVDFLWDLGNG